MRGNALTLSSRTPGVEIPVAEVDGVANLVKTSTLFAKHILREWQSKAMIGPESDKYLKDKIAVSHRVKMIQNRREPRRPMTELGVSCRLGIPSARLTAKRIISPSNHSPRLSLDCRALYSRHIISLSALFALAPIFPSSCAVQAVLYPHLALGFFSAGRATRALPMWALATQGLESFIWIEGQHSDFFFHSPVKQHTADATD